MFSAVDAVTVILHCFILVKEAGTVVSALNSAVLRR